MKEFLEKLNACDEAMDWIENRTIEQIVENCHRGDWFLWLAKKIKVDLQILTLAKARCAKTVIHLMKDQRSVDAVLIAEKFGLGNASRDELDAAYAAAAAAYAAAAAAYAAYAAYADADSYAAAADARIKSQLETANICREILGEEIIKIVNEKLKL
jgi:hypothetical protein